MNLDKIKENPIASGVVFLVVIVAIAAIASKTRKVIKERKNEKLLSKSSPILSSIGLEWLSVLQPWTVTWDWNVRKLANKTMLLDDQSFLKLMTLFQNLDGRDFKTALQAPWGALPREDDMIERIDTINLLTSTIAPNFASAEAALAWEKSHSK